MPVNSNYHHPEEREHVDPEERIRPMPLLPAIIAVGMFLWGLVYIFTAGPFTRPMYGDARTMADLQAKPAATAGVAGGSVDGKAIYAANCASCHQATGAGLPGVFPPLADSEWVVGDPHILANILLHGVTGELEVAGVTYNSQMPAFADQLDDAEIAGVANYIRGEWGNSADPLEAELVKAERDAERRSGPFDGGADLKELEGELG